MLWNINLPKATACWDRLSHLHQSLIHDVNYLTAGYPLLKISQSVNFKFNILLVETVFQQIEENRQAQRLHPEHNLLSKVQKSSPLIVQRSATEYKSSYFTLKRKSVRLSIIIILSISSVSISHYATTLYGIMRINRNVFNLVVYPVMSFLSICINVYSCPTFFLSYKRKIQISFRRPKIYTLIVLHSIY